MSFLGLKSINSNTPGSGTSEPGDSHAAPEGNPEQPAGDGGASGPNNKVRYTIGAVIAAYLLYLDYQLLDGLSGMAGLEKIAMIAVMVVFLVAAVILLVGCVRGMMKS